MADTNLTPVATMNPSLTFQCKVCLENDHCDPPRNINGRHVCPECVPIITNQFENAIKNELAYPVTAWGQELRPGEFADIIGTEIGLRYKRRELEYLTLPKNRIYCTNKILSESAPEAGDTDRTLLALTPAELEKAVNDGKEVEFCGAMIARRDGLFYEDLIECWRCLGTTKLSEISDTEDDNERAKALKGLTRGKDYQLCPDCGTAVQLKEACNHMTCPIKACPNSRTGFCFVYGKGGLPDGDSHWAAGGCPMYNQPAVLRPLPNLLPRPWPEPEIVQAPVPPRPVQAIIDRFLPRFDAFMEQYQERDANRLRLVPVRPHALQYREYTLRERILIARSQNILIQTATWARTDRAEREDLGRQLGRLLQRMSTVLKFMALFHRREHYAVKLNELRHARDQINAGFVETLRDFLVEDGLSGMAELVDFYLRDGELFVDAALALPPYAVERGIAWAYEE